MQIMASSTHYELAPPPERLIAPVGRHTEEYLFYKGLGSATSNFVCVLVHGWLGGETLYPVAHTLQKLSLNVAVVSQKRRPRALDLISPNAQRSKSVHAVTKHALAHANVSEVVFMAHSNGQQDAIHAAQQAAKIRKETGVSPYKVRGLVGVAGVGMNGKKVHPWNLHNEAKGQLLELSRNPDENLDIIKKSLQNLLANPPRSAVEAVGAMIYDGRQAVAELVENHDIESVNEYYYSSDSVIPPPDDCSDVVVLDGSHLTPLIRHDAWIMGALNIAA